MVRYVKPENALATSPADPRPAVGMPRDVLYPDDKFRRGSPVADAIEDRGADLWSLGVVLLCAPF